LRTEIHSAFDAITPATGGMAERVVDTARRDAQPHQRRNRLMVRIQAPMSLVAALVAIALVAAVLIGGQALRIWNEQHIPLPAVDTFQAQVAELEARPLVLPSFKSQADCVSGPFNGAHDLGSGPLSGFKFSGWSSSWGVYYDNVVYTDSRISGPILVRARDVFGDARAAFFGPYAAGPVVGSEVIDGATWQQRPEMVLTADRTSITPNPHKFHWDFISAMPRTWSGSSGWQIDGVGFSEVFVAC
jgi:hypothetical protein